MNIIILLGLLAVAGCTSFSRKWPPAEQAQAEQDSERWFRELQDGKLNLVEYYDLLEGQKALDRIKAQDRAIFLTKGPRR